MDTSRKLNRRDFSKLTAAALGGLAAGTITGCGEPAGGGEKHACRGLNQCKNQGASGSNACAGAGTCATAEHHSCAGDNACKGQGGCGEAPGLNECKGKGGCHVPLEGDMWQKARTAFEEKMKTAGKDFQSAPAK